jgi:spore maturation protein CgeB
MLTTRSEEQHVWFPEDEACLMYETLDELREKVVFVLGKPEVAREIRRMGMERVKNHTYRARAEEILGMVG